MSTNKKTALYVVIAVAISACGEENKEEKASNPVTNPPEIIDKALSFYGTVAVGKGVPNTVVTAGCQNNSVGAGLSDSYGNYSFDVKNGVLPCVLTTKAPDGSTLRAMANSQGIANINSFSELHYVLSSGKPEEYDDSLIKTYAALKGNGISLSQNPIRTQFELNGTGIDGELDKFGNIAHTISNSDEFVYTTSIAKIASESLGAALDPASYLIDSAKEKVIPFLTSQEDKIAAGKAIRYASLEFASNYSYTTTKDMESTHQSLTTLIDNVIVNSVEAQG